MPSARAISAGVTADTSRIDQTVLSAPTSRHLTAFRAIPRDDAESELAWCRRFIMPIPTLESVVRCDPDVLGGTPVFAGTRVPIKNLVDYLAAGDPLERFLDHFPSVTRDQAVAALEIAGSLLTSRAHPAR